MAVGLTKLIPGMSTRNLAGGEELPARKAENRKYGILGISQPYRPPRPVAGIALLFFNFNYR
jgi:hypothetical protein